MRSVISATDLDGYAADEVDFAARLAAAGPQAQQAVDENVIRPLVDAISNEDQPAVLIVHGHADRIDDASLSHAAALQKEGEAGFARAESAGHGLLQMLGEFFAVTQWSDLPSVVRSLVGRGAAHVIASGTTEADARQNRRVQLIVIRFFVNE